MIGVRDKFMPGRDQKMFLFIMKTSHSPSMSSLKFSRAPGLFADKFLSNMLYFLITSDTIRT